MSSLHDALTLRALGTGEWATVADARYEANTGMFGGWTAAVLLRAASADPRAQGTPSTLTVHYIKRVPPSSEVQIRTRLLGESRSLGYWQAELSLVGDDQVAALGTIIVASRRPSDGFTEPAMPSAPVPNGLPEVHPPGTFGERTLIRPVFGLSASGEPFDQPNTKSLAWVRELSGRAVDHAQLAFLSDVYAPRIFLRSKAPRPSSTITMSVYFHATDDELTAIGDDYVLSEVTGTRAEHSTVGSQARLWSRAGALLATTEQQCWFR